MGRFLAGLIGLGGDDDDDVTFGCTATDRGGNVAVAHPDGNPHDCSREKGHGRPGSDDRNARHKCYCGHEW